MPSQLLVVHERIGTWARQLRPRVAGWPLRLTETRSSVDLDAALRGAVCPLLVLDLGRRPRVGLNELDRALHMAPEALAMVLDPQRHEGVTLLALELGATHVISGPITPPVVVDLLSRWLLLARRRAEAAGWSASVPGPLEPEPWNWLNPLLAVVPTGPGPQREGPAVSD